MARSQLVDLDFGTVSKIINLPSPSASSDAATKGYVDSAIEGLAWKDSVRVASTANINLAAPGATIDGITMVANDRFLAKNQTSTLENGIYIWNGSSSPATRAADANTSAGLEQAVVTVEEGTSAAATFRQTSVNFTLESGAVAFTNFGTSAAAASETVSGIAEIATQAEADTGTDDARFVTPLKMANWSGRKRKAVATIGDGSATSFNLDHNFATRDIIVTVYKNSGNYDDVIVDVTRPTTNRVTLTFAVAPSASSYNVVVMG